MKFYIRAELLDTKLLVFTFPKAPRAKTNGVFYQTALCKCDLLMQKDYGACSLIVRPFSVSVVALRACSFCKSILMSGTCPPQNSEVHSSTNSFVFHYSNYPIADVSGNEGQNVVCYVGCISILLVSFCFLRVPMFVTIIMIDGRVKR